ncbi:hypothetical protein LCGC14_2180020 [marine sediment metagenome]|uniref:Uncharacterized protein n=1 Tax=marine sediment metagenome TaxID=412755 RepID=A0A0F9E9R6_9ZZZZ
MLRLDIHYNKTCGFENHKDWQEHKDRWGALNIFCRGNKVAENAFILFKQSNAEAIRMIKNEAGQREVTEGFIEAVISNA